MSETEADRARRLPAGAHGIPAEVVARNQRERLIAAIAEVCAEESYAEIAVADIVRRAGVSTATFYKRLASKRECLLAAHEELLARLLEEVGRSCSEAPDRRSGVRAGIATTLGLFARDAPTARLLLVEILALGPEGAERYAILIDAFSTRLRGSADRDRTERALRSDWAAAAAMAAVVARLVMAGEAAALPELEDELVALASPAIS